jgi:predicted amidohydrolase
MTAKKKQVGVALIQLDVGADKKANLEKAEHYCHEAAREGVDIIALPEMFNWMGPFERSREAAEGESGLSITMLKNISREYHCYIVGGSILERQKKGRPLNTTFFIGRNGKIIACYSKMHLFDYEVKGEKSCLYEGGGKISYLESKAMLPGKSLTAIKTAFGKIGLAICNDLRYPETFRNLTLYGCEMIFVSNAFTERTGREHWHALNRVRAFENQIYIISTNQSGHNAEGIKYFGHSMVVDPWGRIVVEGPPDGDVILYATIDLENVKKIRSQLPALKKIHRKYTVVIC